MLVLNEVALVVHWKVGRLVVPESCVRVAWCLKDDVIVLGDDRFVLLEDGFTSIITQLSN